MSRDSLPGGRCSRFYDSQAPPPWLRVVMYGVPVALVIFGYIDGRDDGRVWTAVLMAVVWLLFFSLSIQIGVTVYGGICVDQTHLRVGRRRSVALADLDLSTLRFAAGAEIYDVYGARNVKSNPMWLPHTVAVDGHDQRGSISVVVKTRRPEELVAALRAGVPAA